VLIYSWEEGSERERERKCSVWNMLSPTWQRAPIFLFLACLSYLKRYEVVCFHDLSYSLLWSIILVLIVHFCILVVFF
jgi:hypothetical protein